MGKEGSIASPTGSSGGPLLGHTEQRSMLERLTRAGRLPSAMLFAGSPGIGKKLIALELARTLFCEAEVPPYGGCGQCKHCRLVNVGNLPDLISFDCLNREKFDIERLRELLHTLGMRPFLGGSRVVIFDNADHLTVQAANVLLKSLEEPRPHNHFILVCSNPGTLPPTLLSRCQIWFFDKLTPDQVAKVLAAQGRTGSIDDLVELADGTLDGIGSLQERLSEWHSLNAELKAIAGGQTATAIQLAAEIAKDKERLRENLGLLRTAARNLLLHSTDQDSAFRWSTCVLDLISAERLIFDRNLGAAYVLTLVLTKAAEQRSFTRSLRGATLLDQVAV